MAVTETLTFCASSTRRLAVTVTLWISPKSAAFAAGVACAHTFSGASKDQAPKASEICVARQLRCNVGIRNSPK